jgi:hypothetical protein
MRIQPHDEMDSWNLQILQQDSTALSRRFRGKLSPPNFAPAKFRLFSIVHSPPRARGRAKRVGAKFSIWRIDNGQWNKTKSGSMQLKFGRKPRPRGFSRRKDESGFLGYALTDLRNNNHAHHSKCRSGWVDFFWGRPNRALFVPLSSRRFDRILFR